MADTRCANPEYQLEVDTMMLEYTLHHAIYNKLKGLKSELLHKAPDGSITSDAADKMVVIFDILVNLFKHHHPTIRFSAGTTFNIKILEFVLLLVQWLRDDPCDHQLLRERRCNTESRRQWLRSWIAANNSDQSCQPTIQVLSSKTDPDSASINLTADVVTVSLTDLLVRFLDLSAEISESMGFVNEAWYRLAVEFMLQCAIERVEHYAQPPTSATAGTKSNDTATKHLMTAVAECFAWGAINVQSSTTFGPDKRDRWLTRHLEEQTYITRMFESRETDGKGNNHGRDEVDVKMHDGDMPDENSAIEHPVWTRLRTEYLKNALDLVEAHTDMSSDRDRHALARQRRRRPLIKFVSELHEFIDGLWHMNLKEEMSGKPVLVQIEEGGIDGMGDDQFKEFLDRVGLKMGHQDGSGRGVVRWIR